MTTLNTTLWRQFGAAIKMLENALHACPDELWRDEARNPQYWYLVYHTLFWLDYYLADSDEGFAPPPPFTMCEMDPAGVLPDRVYTKAEMQAYLDHGRAKLQDVLTRYDDVALAAPRRFGSVDGTGLESLLYNMRHVQHHSAQLNLLLRQEVDDAPRWVGKVD